jgi:protein-disulfide isomerase
MKRLPKRSVVRMSVAAAWWHIPQIPRTVNIAIMSIVLALLSLTTVASCYSQSIESQTAIEEVVKNYLAAHPEAVERIVREYLIKHPDVVQAAIVQLLLRRAAVKTKAGAAAANPLSDKSAAIKSSAPILFNSPHQVTLGNPQGNATLVEFFDYNCGYCRRALPDMVGLLKTNPKLKIVLKEFPVLGAPSVEAAQVAVAVRMQDATGAKYLAFHQKLLAGRGKADKQRALEVARELGLDIPRLEHDVTSPEVRATLQENAALARALGINGTPGYVVGNTVLLGAVGLTALKEKVYMAHH